MPGWSVKASKVGLPRESSKKNRRAIGLWYGYFGQTNYEDVRDYLAHLTSAFT
jgi:hypothetical protein